jgi:hypothetical protein
MSATTLSRPARLLRIITGGTAIVAGLAWVAKDVGSRISPDPDYWDCNSSYDYVLNGIDIVAFLGLGLAVFGVRKLFRDTIGQKRAGIGAAGAAGFAVAGIANLLEHCAGLDAFGFPYVVGLMLGMLLLFGFGLALMRAPIPTWCTGLLLVGTAAGLLLANQGGLIAFGCACVLFGVVLLRPLRLSEI